MHNRDHCILPLDLSREDQGPAHAFDAQVFGRSPGLGQADQRLIEVSTARPFPDPNHRAQWL